MAEWQYAAMSVTEMTTAFLVDKLPPIAGRPSLCTLLKALQIIMPFSSLGPLGYLFVALPKVHYQQFTNVPLVLPGPTPAVSQYTPNMNPADCNTTKLEWQAHNVENYNIWNMNKTLTSLFLAAIQATFKHHLQNNFVGITTQLLWQIFQFFLDRYGRVTPQNINDNLKKNEGYLGTSRSYWKMVLAN